MSDSQQTSYTALIGDVVGSRKVKDRAGLQRRLRAAVAGINDRLTLEDALAVPLTITSGDEIQDLLVDPKAAVDAAIYLADAIAPEWMRFGLGYGPISTGLAQTPAEVDGPCFHRAREALESTDRDFRWLGARGFGDDLERGLEGVFGLMAAIRRTWTARQAEIVRHARKETVQKVIAQTLEVSPSVVSESLRAARFRAILAGERTARWLLSTVSQN